MFDTLFLDDAGTHITVTINRLDRCNSINLKLLQELHSVLDHAENAPECRTVILQGQNNIFCTGLDFNELISWDFDSHKIKCWAQLYMQLLKRFSTTSSAVITKLDGKVVAGGTGLAAAGDLVISTNNSSIKLTEALWGLLPAMVAPYLIRRIGIQKTQELALTCKTVTADEACRIGFIDEIVEPIDEVVEKACSRFQRLEKKTIAELKSYFRKLWIIDEEMEHAAIDTIVKLLQDPANQNKIKTFVRDGTAPWTKESL